MFVSGGVTLMPNPFFTIPIPPVTIVPPTNEPPAKRPALPKHWKPIFVPNFEKPSSTPLPIVVIPLNPPVRPVAKAITAIVPISKAVLYLLSDIAESAADFE